MRSHGRGATWILLLSGFSPGALSAPTVADPATFSVEKFVDVTGPQRLAFDAAGNLYVGRNRTDPEAPDRILKVTPGGVVSEFGDLISDPDSVAVDTEGLFAAPGSVLVSGMAYLEPLARISAISPDGQSTSLLVETPRQEGHN